MSNELPVVFSKKEKVAYITFNRPPANAYNLAFMKAFYDAVCQANNDHEAGCVVINSRSEKFFCPGADIKEFQSNSIEDNQKMIDQARATMHAIESSDKIFIAQIPGHALGGGLEIALVCDLRFATDGKGLLGLPEIKLGLMPGDGGSQRLARLVGASRAMEWLVTGNAMSMQEGHRIGLINRLYTSDELAEKTTEFALSIANGALLAVAATKRAVKKGIELSLEDGLRLEQEECDALYDTQDASEGFKSFVEKRSPVFVGK